MIRRGLIGAFLALLTAAALAASGYQVGGVDLDSIFAPEQAGWPQAGATGYRVGGADFNARYAPLSMGTQIGSNTGYQVGGTDLRQIFAAINSTGVAISTQPSAVSGSAAAGYPSGAVTSNSTSCAAIHGNSAAYSYSWHIASGSASPTAPSSATSAVTNSAVPAGTILTGTEYCSITDGVTSVNTNTVGWSLQNTTPAVWSFSIVAGQNDTLIGYYTGVFGSITSGQTLPSGQNIYAVWQDTILPAGTIASGVIISGFSSNPGSAFFTSLAINGKTFVASAATYTYGVAGPGWAEWQWSNDPYGFSSGTTYPGAFTPP